MKNIKPYENFSVNENLDNSDMGKIINEGISDKSDKKFLNEFKKYCKEKLVPLKFEGYVRDENMREETLVYYKMVGMDKYDIDLLETCVHMDICCDPLEKDLIIEVRFGLDTDKTFRYCYKKTYSANFLTSDISKIKNAVDKVVYLNNLMFKNFAEKIGIPKNKVVEQQKKFKEILIKDGFETEDGDSEGGLFGKGGLGKGGLFNFSLFKSVGMRRI
jgi:hypothetical protein